MRDIPSIDFIDLKAQYRELKQSINERIQIVLDHDCRNNPKPIITATGAASNAAYRSSLRPA